MLDGLSIPPVSRCDSLWSVATEQPQIDPALLAEALERGVGAADLDFRSRLLIRDSLDALEIHWGAARLARWLDECKSGSALRGIWKSDLGPPGFPTPAFGRSPAGRKPIAAQRHRQLVHRVWRIPSG